MTDLVERLRTEMHDCDSVNDERREAAAEIERLTRLNEAGWKDLKEKHVEIERLEAQVESLQNKWANRPLSRDDADAEIERLKERGDIAWGKVADMEKYVQHLESVNAALMECFEHCKVKHQHGPCLSASKVEALLEASGE